MKINFVAVPLLVLLLAYPGPAQKEEGGAKTGMGKPTASEYATIGGGCFWCLEAVYERLPGIRAVVSGYAGGMTPDPTYKLVCTGTTGHAEVVRIEFDPSVTEYREILEIFWDAHDPTTLNRQGADIGSQYRSMILFENESQRVVAEQSRAEAAKKFSDPIVTEIVPLKKFTPAEEYHQDYFRKNPNAPYCMLVIQPKLKKLDKGK